MASLGAGENEVKGPAAFWRRLTGGNTPLKTSATRAILLIEAHENHDQLAGCCGPGHGCLGSSRGGFDFRAARDLQITRGRGLFAEEWQRNRATGLWRARSSHPHAH